MCVAEFELIPSAGLQSPGRGWKRWAGTATNQYVRFLVAVVVCSTSRAAQLGFQMMNVGRPAGQAGAVLRASGAVKGPWVRRYALHAHARTHNQAGERSIGLPSLASVACLFHQQHLVATIIITHSSSALCCCLAGDHRLGSKIELQDVQPGVQALQPGQQPAQHARDGRRLQR